VKLLRDVGGTWGLVKDPFRQKKMWSKKGVFLRHLKIRRKIAYDQLKWVEALVTRFEPLHIFDQSKVPATTQKKGFNRA